MGIKVPKDSDYLIKGNDCGVCTPSLWRPGQTPKYVWAVFYDIEACPPFGAPPNNHLFKLKQTPLFSCAWDYQEPAALPHWRVTYDAFQGRIFLDLHTDHGNFPYFYGDGDQCSYYWPANLRECFNSAGHKGRAVVGFFEDNLIPSLTMEYHFVPRDRTYYERQDVGIDHVLVRLACRKFSSNILIYIDYEDFDFV